GIGDAQVGVAIHIHQADVRMPAPEPANEAERDGAVTAHDQRQPASRRIGDRIGHLARHPHHRGQIAASRMVTIGNELRAGQIPHVQNGLPSRAKPLCQPGGAQRVGCPLLPCVMRPGAAGHPDHHPVTHLSLLLITSYCCQGNRQASCRLSPCSPASRPSSATTPTPSLASCVLSTPRSPPQPTSTWSWTPAHLTSRRRRKPGWPRTRASTSTTPPSTPPGSTRWNCFLDSDQEAAPPCPVHLPRRTGRAHRRLRPGLRRTRRQAL